MHAYTHARAYTYATNKQKSFYNSFVIVQLLLVLRPQWRTERPNHLSVNSGLPFLILYSASLPHFMDIGLSVVMSVGHFDCKFSLRFLNTSKAFITARSCSCFSINLLWHSSYSGRILLL